MKKLALVALFLIFAPYIIEYFWGTAWRNYWVTAEMDARRSGLERIL